MKIGTVAFCGGLVTGDTRQQTQPTEGEWNVSRICMQGYLNNSSCCFIFAIILFSRKMEIKTSHF